ncbi:MAG: hypothetical protein AVDCRST_MAG56-3080 [uncultured Cytophagales bacterium]|uniref:FAS1 domain-containing protein n=1 Tax=uncultured Cytophagales bacterium TaxID=158755 RepID=A0A6J4J657_9SPHI|nr:MAG: hypothetical protein AVDCRST_MAG56-3080 [uncultured Cytophagales bacterium]
MTKPTTARVPVLLRFTLGVLLTAFLLNGCRKDDDYFEPPAGQEGKLLEQLKANPEFSTYVRALELAKLEQTVGSSGLYTIFAPTNQAFDAYFSQGPYRSLEQIPPRQLYELVGNHILTPMMFTFDFSARRFNNNKDDRYQTNALKYAKVIRSGAQFTINGVEVSPDRRDIAAANGAIHGIPAVLVPRPAIDSVVQLENDLRIFNRVLRRFAFREVDQRRSQDLDNDGVIDTIYVKRSRLALNPGAEDPEITALAPTDQAFEDLLAQYPQFRLVGTDSLDMPDNVLKPIIEYHLLTGARTAAGLTGDLVTAGRETLPAAAIPVAEPNISVSNGALHKVSKVLIPPSLGTVGGQILLNKDKDLTQFIAALEKAALLRELLSADKKYTVFAPTNQAFTDAGINVAALTGAQLEPILKTHVLTSEVKSTGLVDGKLYPTLLGPGVKVAGASLLDPTNQPAPITAVDFAGSNGVYHKLGRVMTPPAVKVLATFIDLPQFSELKAALTKAGLLAALDAAGPFTIFAPNNQAFQDFYAQRGVAGLSALSSAELKDLLQYHVVGERLFSTDLTNAQEKGTLLTGKKLRFNVAGGAVTIADLNAVSPDAAVVGADGQGTNGVVHTISKVLQP